MSRKATDKKTALLQAVDLTSAQIAQHSRANPLNEEEAIQAGLEAWIDDVNPTWGDLLKAMETAKIALSDRNELEAKLLQ